MKKSILVLHGPNLDRLGSREPAIYGTTTLAELDASLLKLAHQAGWRLSSFQSNSEGLIIDAIHGAADNGINYLVINAAAFTHTSIAIRDAIISASIPFYEIHISNIFAREPFRHHSWLSDIAQGIICGFGVKGYSLAVQAILEETNQESY